MKFQLQRELRRRNHFKAARKHETLDYISQQAWGTLEDPLERLEGALFKKGRTGCSACHLQSL